MNSAFGLVVAVMAWQAPDHGWTATQRFVSTFVRRSQFPSRGAHDRRYAVVASGRITVHIERPAKEVFEYVSDVENNPAWRTAVTETRWLDPGPTKPGRRGEQTSRLIGRRYSVRAEVVDWEPPLHVSWATTAGGADVRTHCRVEEDGSGCRVTLESEGEFTGVWRLLTPLAAMMLRQRSKADIERLRAILEDRQD